MTERNRVSPFGAIEALDLRGAYTGNRGCLHRGREIVRPWNGRRWITCVLSYKDWHHEQWVAGTWTALFFLDEAVSLAAGHRPCALCRRDRYDAWRDAWSAANGGCGRPSADAMDHRLHADRLDGRRQRVHGEAWASLPDDTFVWLDDGTAARVDGDALLPWTGGQEHGIARRRPRRGSATVLTPLVTVAVLRAGYRPERPPTQLGADRFPSR